MGRAWLAVLLLAVACRPAGEEGAGGEGAGGEGVQPAPGAEPGAAPSGGTDDVQQPPAGSRGTNGTQGTDGAMGTNGTRPGTVGTRPGTTPTPPGTTTPGTEPGTARTGTPGTGQGPAADTKEATAQALADIHQAHVHELALARLATEKSADPGVRSYAEQEIKDHTQADAGLVELARKEGISWENADPSRYKEQTATVERLRGLDGVAFEQAYVLETVKDHDGALTLVEAQLTTVQDPEILAHLQQVRPILQAHRDRARQLRPGEQGT